MDKGKMEIRKLVELKEAVKYLCDFVSALEKGEIKLEQGEQEMLLKPAELVEVEVGAKSKKGKEKFSLEISWRAPVDAGEELTISPGGEAAKTAPEPAKKPTAAAKPAAAKPAAAKKTPAKTKAAAKPKTPAKPKAAAKPAAPKTPAEPASGTGTGSVK